MSVSFGAKRLSPRARNAAPRRRTILRPTPVEPTPDMAADVPAWAASSAAALIAPMPPAAASEYGSATVLDAVRRDRAVRRTRFHSHRWFPLAVLLVVICCGWGALKADQLIAEKLIWPTSGAQFVEVGPRPDDPSVTGGPMTIVVAGLNRKSGTGVATALMPSLAVDHTRVFSLVYGSGISDQDILDKFDALVTQYQPSQVSFFASSMGGDVVLNLAAHTQSARDEYRQSTVAAAPVADPSQPGGSARGGERADAPGSGAAVSGGTDGEPDQIRNVLPETGAATGHGVSGNTVPGIGIAAAGNIAASALVGGAVDTGAGTDSGPPAPQVPPRLGTIYLDCSPLGADDVRDSSRTQADFITGLTEALDTDGGVAVRLSAEVLAQRDEWSTGEFPFLQVRWDEFRYKVDQVWQEKIGAPGISTELIKDQYGVIRRTDIGDVVDALRPGTRIVYFLPENRHDDRTIRVEQVETTLRALAPEHRLDLRVVPIPGGQHASAESNSEVYRAAIDALNRAGT